MSSPIHQLSSRRYNAYPSNASLENFTNSAPLISRRPFTAAVVNSRQCAPSRPSSSSSNLLPRRARTAPPRLARKQSQASMVKADDTASVNEDVENQKSVENDIAVFTQKLKNRHQGSLGSLLESEKDVISEEAPDNQDSKQEDEPQQPMTASVPRSRTPPRTPPPSAYVPDGERSRRGSKVILDPRLIYDRTTEQNATLEDETVQPEWLKRRNCYGFPYYEHRDTSEETWEKPVVLPKGWEERNDGSGFPYYLDCRTGFITWEKPEVLPAGWERQTSKDGRLYYLHYRTDISAWDKPNDKTLETLQRPIS
ncbi:uncharacterized protein LOC144452923 [Glandiceps talaboti]